MRNKHGLSRSIPSLVKRIVRKKCGYGCVICGIGIIHYEHVDPEFHDAKEHDPDKIALLCPNCHNKVTTRFWSKEKIKAAMKAPYSIKHGHSHETFDFNNKNPVIHFGGAISENVRIPIMLDGIPLLQIDEPEDEDAPYRLSGFFCDSTGAFSLILIENEWFALTRNWDVEIVGPTLTIREKERKIHLRITIKPPNHVHVERLYMLFKGIQFISEGGFLKVIMANGNTAFYHSTTAKNTKVAFDFVT